MNKESSVVLSSDNKCSIASTLIASPQYLLEKFALKNYDDEFLKTTEQLVCAQLMLIGLKFFFVLFLLVFNNDMINSKNCG